ncbi:MAG: ABC transporter substrate-binding protein [Actinomycetota bacterium]|nr:ABC transporter substrate-binding protein [Actinomycetota bacterium]
MPVRRPLAAVLTASALIPLSACSSGSDNSTVTQASPTGSTSAGVQVPAAIRAKGTLTVAADASYAPNEFFAADGKTVKGMDADLAKALGTQLGLRVTVVNAGFDAIIPGLASGKYDLGMSSFTDTKKREATVDFVTYFSAGTSFYGKPGGTAVTALTELCGHTVAVEKGTTQLDDATAQGKTCKTGGKKAVTVQVYPDQNGANLALSSGRADVGMADSPVAAYAVKQSKGAFVVFGQPYGTAPYGIAIPKGNGLAPAILDALTKLIANGTYTRVLTTWGVQAGAITTPVINGATS